MSFGKVGISLLILIGVFYTSFCYPNPPPVNLGEVGGKTFYKGDNGYEGDHSGWNWTEASEYCDSHGLQLGTIETKKEADFVLSSDLNDYYWTSGRDSQDYRQFTWNTTNLEVLPIANLYVFPMPFGIPFQTCLLISSIQGGIFIEPCSLKIINGGVLCETKD